MKIDLLRRIFSKSVLKTFDLGCFANSAKMQLMNGELVPMPTLSERMAMHVAYFSTGNAGDSLLPIVLRDLFSVCGYSPRWVGQHVHEPIDSSFESRAARCDLIVVGGGGLFLKDTNPNQISGWQWAMPTSNYADINSKLAVFAVGYNRFRGQKDFDSIFTENLRALVEKSCFFGLRNTGSIDAISAYLPDHLRKKVSFQPCMTTVISKIYPERFSSGWSENRIIAVNCAFDRADLRFGDRTDEILNVLSLALKSLSRDYEIHYYAHTQSDLRFLPYLDSNGVGYIRRDLYHRSPEEVLKAYQTPAVVVGMRGHAQMIPFGCLVPIISLISHDKMRWFLDDIKAQEWGVEMGSLNFGFELEEKVRHVLGNRKGYLDQVREKQEELWNVSRANVLKIISDTRGF